MGPAPSLLSTSSTDELMTGAGTGKGWLEG